MTEAKISFCDNCNSTVIDNGLGTVDSGTRVITIIEATDELDGNTVLSSNSIFSNGKEKRMKRGVEVASLTGNETVTGDDSPSLMDEMIRSNPSEAPKPTPIKRGAGNNIGMSDMTQAIMEPRVDYDVDEEFRAANGHGYDAPRTRPVNNYRGYSSGSYNQRQHSEPIDIDDHLEDAESDDFEDGDHNSHYEYVPMEFDDEGNHR